MAIFDFSNFEFDDLKRFLLENDVEGIVFHHVSDGRMCKLRKSDFGIKRSKLEMTPIKNANNLIVSNHE